VATHIWKLILPFLLALTLGNPAWALVIDDFEGGAFSYSGTSAGDGGTQNVSPPAQVLGGSREVYVASNLFDFTADADLAPTALVDDAVSLVLPTLGGVLDLTYAPPAPFDLTLEGSATEIEVTMPLGTAGATLSVELTDTSAGSDSVTAPILGETPSYSFALGDFATVNPTQIETIQVSVTSTAAGSFEIGHIALRGSGSPVLWQVIVDQVSGPPYPSSPVEFEACAGVAHPPDPCMPIAVAALSIVEAKMAIPPSILPFELVALGNGEAGSGGEQVGIEANWLPEPLDEYPDEAAFELELELQPLGGVTPRLGIPPSISPSPESFRVSFTVLYEDDQGQIVGTARHHLHFQIGAGQPLEFNGVSATEGSVVINFGTTRMGIEPSPFTPIFTMTISAEFSLGPPIPAVPPLVFWFLAAVILVTIATLGQRRLRARE
jgi:hypothetical protein